MQYNNRRASMTARAIIKTTFAILGMGVAIAFLSTDDTLAGAKWALTGALVIAVLLTSSGGLYEMDVQGDSSFLDITCSPILQTKGRSRTYSIPGGSVLSVSNLNLLIVHKLKIEYIGHRGKPKTARIGLTLMSARQRERLLQIVGKLGKAQA